MKEYQVGQAHKSNSHLADRLSAAVHCSGVNMYGG